MQKFKLIIVLLIAIGAQSADPEVNTKFGRVRGKLEFSSREKVMDIYLGLPYAKPPIDDLRFKNPQIWTEKWSGTRNATTNGPTCIQIDYKGEITGEEDCLYLNVFASRDKSDPISNEGEVKPKRKLPVLIFIRGGSFNQGTTDSKIFSPDYLLNEEIVLVTFNYRLNFLGFYSTGNNASPGNYGLKDMVVVLKWVHENIADFGGDPESVTLFGNSAGAAAIHYLTLSQKTKGLFHKIITMSGSALAPWAFQSRENIKNDSINLARMAGCFKMNETQTTPAYNDTTEIYFENNFEEDNMTDHERVECMRKINASDLLNLTKRLAVWKTSPYCVFGPTLEKDTEGAIVTIHPRKATEDALFQDIPWIIGVVADEGLGLGINFDNESLREFTENFTQLGPYVMNYQQVVKNKDLFSEALIDYYFQGNISQNFKTNATQMFGDATIYWPVYEALQNQGKKMKSNVYFYHFAYEGTFSVTLDEGKVRQRGVAHMDDVNYLFPFLNNKYKNLTWVNSRNDKTMINIMTELWINFAKTGKPSAQFTIEWEPYQKDKKFMRLGNGSSTEISMENDFLEGRMKFWETLMKNASYPLEETVAGNNETNNNNNNNNQPSSGGASFIYGKHIILNCLALLLFLCYI